MKDCSIVIPVFNEQDNIPILYPRLKEMMEKLNRSYEIIFIDDGSTDKTFLTLKKIQTKDKKVKVIQLKKNFGQTAALSAGFDHAQGRVIITMDGDLQNDPRDIPELLRKIDDGFDLVNGWRTRRHDPFLSKKIPSYFANKFISYFTGVKLNDYGCTLKAYKKEVIENIKLYGEMHRFIPALASWTGASIVEIPVRHHQRKYGRSKYGLTRAIKVALDLVTVKFFLTYQTKPIYVFGSFGIVLLVTGFLSFTIVTFQKLFLGVWVHLNPLMLLAIFSPFWEFNQ
jgi:glycosyltransferase involved in cell wall biosynthesis